MNGKKTLLAIVAGLMLLAATGFAVAEGEAEQAQVTVQGEILDMACYVAHEAQGEEHAGCAKRCVKGGQPMGLLAEDGTVYLLYASHKDGSAYETAKEHAGEKVEISGVAASRAGIRGLEVDAVKPL